LLHTRTLKVEISTSSLCTVPSSKQKISLPFVEKNSTSSLGTVATFQGSSTKPPNSLEIWNRNCRDWWWRGLSTWCKVRVFYVMRMWRRMRSILKSTRKRSRCTIVWSLRSTTGSN